MASARHPNTYTPHAVAGRRAISTSTMIVDVVSGFLRWGADVTVRGFLV
jgi:hypothetical protein